MISRYYLVYFSSTAMSNTALTEVLRVAAVAASANGLELGNAVDLSLAMGKTSLGVQVDATAENHGRLVTAWRSCDLTVEDLTGEVRGLGSDPT